MLAVELISTRITERKLHMAPWQVVSKIIAILFFLFSFILEKSKFDISWLKKKSGFDRVVSVRLG